MRIAVLIVAAGRGERAGTAPGGLPKQYRPLAGRPVLARTVSAFIASVQTDLIQVVIHPDDGPLYQAALGALQQHCRPPVLGRANRQGSVLAGLEALVAANPDCVLIHDAARPFVEAVEIERVIAALATAPAAIAAVPVVDTLKRVDAAAIAKGTVDRTGLWAARTPQGFRFVDILAAHRSAQTAGRMDFTDDAAVAEWAGMPVKVVEGSNGNIKLTTLADFHAAELMLSQQSRTGRADVRNGTGFDVHRFCDGDAVWLCGVRIPHDRGLEGHSDADVGLHALTDAILGALGDGDIGEHFPPHDPQWRGAPSRVFLQDAANRARARAAVIGNVDVTLLCEAPRIGPHRLAMRRAIADTLGIDVERVGVKATTTERLGFTGRREGIAAMATATLVFN